MHLEKLRVFHHPLWEAKELRTQRVSFGRCGLAEQAAKVVEVPLVGGRFLALVTRPFPLEFGGGHGSAANSTSFSRHGMGAFYPKLDKLKVGNRRAHSLLHAKAVMDYENVHPSSGLRTPSPGFCIT